MERKKQAMEIGPKIIDVEPGQIVQIFLGKPGKTNYKPPKEWLNMFD